MSAWTVTFEPILSRLVGFADQGNMRGRAQCPCDHGGEQADLYLSVGDTGGLLLKCYPRKSGIPACRAEDVMSVIGLPMAALFPRYYERERERAKKPEPKRGAPVRAKDDSETFQTVAEYEYRDPDLKGPDGLAALVYKVIKKRGSKGGKDYPQCRPNPSFNPKLRESKENPAWVWNLAGVKKVLYRLPELRAGLQERPDRFVIVPEGEQDVDTARAMGLVATCNGGGVLKWDQVAYNDELKGCNVVLIPDEDPVFEDRNRPGTFRCPGIEHVRDVATKLLPFAKSVRLLRLPGVPPHGDLTDWRRGLANVSDADAKAAFAELVKSAPLLVTPEDVLKIAPRGEPVWPVPPGQWAATLPNPNAQPAPSAPGPAAAPVPAGGADVFAAVRDVLRALPSGPLPANAWVGDVWFALSAFESSLVGMSKGYPGAARQAATVLAAQLLRGLYSVPELKAAE